VSVFQIKQSVRNIKRYREIITILLRYGFADIIDQLHIDLAIQRLSIRPFNKKQLQHAHKSRPERIRLALEELGPTFIKLGQMLSTRFDLIPLEYITELRKLQDNVKPFPVEEVIRIIEKELGASVDQLFSQLDRKPVAAASIAQVHRACTAQGDEVVIKVRRPDIVHVIDTDIHILKDLAALLEKHIPESRVFDPSGLVSQFQGWICDELNFLQEARNVHRFKKYFTDDSTVYVPDVFWELTTDKILALEYIRGIPIDDTRQLEEAGMDLPTIARNGTLFAFRQIFEFHFFHGDPHPGNLFVLPDHVIAPLDYGLMGRMDRVLVGHVGDLLRGIINNDPAMIVRTLIRLNRLKVDVDRESLRIDVSDFLERYHAVPLHMLKFEYFFNDLVRLIRRNQIQFPRNLYLMGKALIIMESVAQKLDPKFDIISIARTYFTKSMIGRAEAERFFNNLSNLADDYMDLAISGPQNLSQILNKIRWGKLGVNLNHQRIDEFMHSIDRSANRLAYSILIASLIVGSALMMNLQGPRLWNLSLFSILGLGMAGVLGIWLIVSIFRSGKL
jgi:ubiquinone biosynthesis protein